MIIRVWRGWTTPQNADAYEALLREEIAGESVNGEQTPGMLGIDVLRHDPDATDGGGQDGGGGGGGESGGRGDVEFSTIMYFFDWDSVRAFAGDELYTAVVPDADRALLTRWDEQSRHYDLLSRNGQWKALADG